MVSVCLPSDALLQHLPSYLDFSYLGHGVSLHGCSSKAQPLLLTLDEGYLLTAAVPHLQRGIAPLGPPVPAQPLLCQTPKCCCSVPKFYPTLQSYGLQHSRITVSSLSPGVFSDLCSLSQCCYQTISSSVALFSFAFCLSSFYSYL